MGNDSAKGGKVSRQEELTERRVRWPGAANRIFGTASTNGSAATRAVVSCSESGYKRLYFRASAASRRPPSVQSKPYCRSNGIPIGHPGPVTGPAIRDPEVLPFHNLGSWQPRPGRGNASKRSCCHISAASVDRYFDGNLVQVLRCCGVHRFPPDKGKPRVIGRRKATGSPFRRLPGPPNEDASSRTGQGILKGDSVPCHAVRSIDF